MRRFALALGFILLGRPLFAQNYDYPVDESDKTPPAELRMRRELTKAFLGRGAVGIFFTNPVRNRNNDVDFKFRADSTFLYLTGFEEPDSALILAPDGVELDGKQTTEILFVNAPNQNSITWFGYRMGAPNVPKLLGIQTAYSNDRFGEILKQVLASKPKLSIAPTPEGATDTLAKMVAEVEKQKSGLALAAGPALGPQLRTMRGVKSVFEQGLLKKVCDISARAHISAMEAIRPGMREWEIAAMMEYGFAKEGCEYSGYPPICGTGPNSTILHYESNRRQMKDGDVICLDSAGEYHGYSADITRSYPVSGKFTPEQRAIYQVVFDAQELGISLCRPGHTFPEIEKAITEKLGEGLIKLGLIKDLSETRKYYPHGFGHGLGLDVHDPAPRTLQAGVTLTVEPGLYIKAGSPCDPKWWNIGIRIEDDILVTDQAPVNMTELAPRKIDDVEREMAHRNSQQSVKRLPKAKKRG